MIKMVFVYLLLAYSSLSLAHDDKPPALWSWHKDLNKSVEACRIQSTFKVKDMGAKNVVVKDYGVFSTFRNNRISTKCVKRGEGSRLWVMVAGYNNDVVELIRNRLINEII